MKNTILLLVMSLSLFADGPVLQTGQTMVYQTGDDGTYQAGLVRSYTRSASGIVTDNATGLQWQDNYDDNAGSVKLTDYNGASTYCNTLTLDGTGWRLPSIEEISTLVDFSRSQPAINTIFEIVGNGEFWSSTSNISSSDSVWVLNMNFGNLFVRLKTNSINAICVRQSSGG